MSNENVIDDMQMQELRLKAREMLHKAFQGFVVRKNSPFTRFQLAMHIRPALAEVLGLTDKKLGEHFDIVVTDKGIDVRPKTDFARMIVS